MKAINKESLEYIISRLIDNANEAGQDCKKDAADAFKQGRKLAYYEMLDILKSELDARDEELSEYGLDINLDDYV